MCINGVDGRYGLLHFSCFHVTHFEFVRPGGNVILRYACRRLVDSIETILKRTDIHVRTQAVRTEGRIGGGYLCITTLAQTPVLMTIKETCAFVAAGVNALHILRGILVIRLDGQMIKTGTSHVASCQKRE